MGGSFNWLLGPPKRPFYKNKGNVDTPQGLSNLLVYHMLSYDQWSRRSIRTTKTLHTNKHTSKQAHTQKLLKFIS